MKELLDAIKSKFTSSLLGTITGGLHLMRSSTSAVPYAVYDVIASPSEQVYSGEGPCSIWIDFTVWHTNAAAGLVLAESLRTAYTTTLTLAGSKKNHYTRPLGQPIPSPESGAKGEDPDGDWTYGWIVRFEFAIS